VTSNIKTLFFEPYCEQVKLEPGDKIDILVSDTAGLYPLDVDYLEDGMQIFPNRASPRWMIQKNGITKSAEELSSW
jgi:hypothetical protein